MSFLFGPYWGHLVIAALREIIKRTSHNSITSTEIEAVNKNPRPPPKKNKTKPSMALQENSIKNLEEN